MRNTVDPVHVIGAAGRIGQAVCRALIAQGVKVVPLVRDPRRWSQTGIPVEPRIVDLLDDYTLGRELSDAVRLIGCASPLYTANILHAADPDVLMALLGDARRYLRAPDLAGLTAMEGERELIGSGRPAAMLHPTLIYGLPHNDPVRRWAGWLHRLPVLPLPAGGRATIQPIALNDVVASLIAAVDRNWPQPAVIPLGGGQIVEVAAFLRLIAEAAGVTMPQVVTLPAGLMPLFAPFTALIPGMRLAGADDLRNLSASRTVDLGPMRDALKVEPRSLEQGLREMFAPLPAR
jgi:nucleoside-diphosphate-sugar epimerase